MNKVFLSGLIVEQPALVTAVNGDQHLIINLSVAHRTKLGAKTEIYRVNAWHSTAVWGNDFLRHGMFITVQGYLTQRFVESYGNRVEVTAEEFFIGQITPIGRAAAPTAKAAPNDPPPQPTPPDPAAVAAWAHRNEEPVDQRYE